MYWKTTEAAITKCNMVGTNASSLVQIILFRPKTHYSVFVKSGYIQSD